MVVSEVQGKPATAASWADLPRWFIGAILKQLQATLTASNKAYGRGFLEGNFSPVQQEVFSKELPVKGTLPKELRGVFLRIGPNPAFNPLGGYHWFDGDGMLHAARIKDGKASYANHWVRTSRYRQEAAAGWPLFAKLGDYVGITGLLVMALGRLQRLLGLVDTRAGGGTANTAMVAHARRLLALHEGDLPYSVRILCNGLVETVGRVTFEGKLTKNFTAHPKVDPVTGKLHFFWYGAEGAPYATYGCASAEGVVEKTLPLDIPRAIMMHDFAITANHSVFMDLPLCFDPQRMVKEKNVPFRFRPELGARIGLLPHSATSGDQMVWFQLPAFMVFHTANAWEEEDGRVQVLACYHDSITLDLDARCTDGVPRAEQPRVARITLHPATGAAEVTLLTNTVGDFPTINNNYTGRKCRYAYVATMYTKGTTVKFDGVAKIDLQAGGIEKEAAEGAVGAGDAAVGRIKLPEGCWNGETVFVPRYEDPSKCAGEDDGFLLTYVHNESTNASSVWVWDAATMAPTPLAQIQLPQRVPYGFHALFMNESQLQAQLPAK